jgi:hypothetical protein
MMMRRDRPPKLLQRETVKIQYGFVYNQESNAIEVNYSFKDGIVETVSARFPPRGGARSQRKQRTQSTVADLTAKASATERVFSEILRPAIERTILESIHLALFKCNVGIENDPGKMINRIKVWHRREIAQGITKTGRRPFFKNRDHYLKTLRSIKKKHGDGKRLTQGEVAEDIGASRPDPVDERMVRQWNSDFGVDWRAFVAESGEN